MCQDFLIDHLCKKGNKKILVIGFILAFSISLVHTVGELKRANPDFSGNELFKRGFIAEEIVRTLVGSTPLILAMPITTKLAAWYFSTREHPKSGK